MIFMTDGQNNRQTSTFNSVLTTAKGYGIIIFAIGVADADPNEMQKIGSSIPGVQTVFYSPTYAVSTSYTTHAHTTHTYSHPQRCLRFRCPNLLFLFFSFLSNLVTLSTNL